jgi:succinate dehydrogenase / fumarate reductase flavoprotein subunit
MSEAVNISTDILVIGSGGSGMFFANQLPKILSNKKITLCSSLGLGESSTSAAKGGINASLSNHNGERDKWQYHAFDTIVSSKFLGDNQQIEYMCRVAPKIINYLDSLGVEFEKDSNGKILQRMYGGQRLNYANGGFAHRSCYNKDKTGKSIVDALKKNIITQADDNSNFEILENLHLVDIIYGTNSSNQKFISRAIFCNILTNKKITITAEAFVFASGGYSGIYSNSTCGSGISGYTPISLLLSAGAVAKDIEFVQFHPTGMYKFSTLVSEACRSEGGYLENENGERFLSKYDERNMELAPRDLISRAIFNEMQKNKTDYVYLNLTHLPADLIKQKLQNTYKNALSFCGIDITKQRLKINPVAHYCMGGISVDKYFKADNFTNCFVIGEAACVSIHGANRLGCNSLLELFYSASLCLKGVKNYFINCTKNSSHLKTNLKTKSCYEQIIKEYKLKNINSDILQDQIQIMRKSINQNIGIIRNTKSIQICKKDLDQILNSVKSTNNTTTQNDKFNECINLVNTINFLSIYKIANYIIKSSLKRKESRGSFYRDDFTKQNYKFEKNSFVVQQKSIFGIRYKVFHKQSNKKIINKDLQINLKGLTKNS